MKKLMLCIHCPEKKDNVPLLSASSSAERINKSWFGFTGRHSARNKCHRAPKQSHGKNLILHFFQTAPLHSLPNCWAGWKAFMHLWPLLHFFHTPADRLNFCCLIHTQPWSTDSPSIHLLLYSQLIAALKIYWIISGGASLLLQEGSKATLRLGNHICAAPGKCSAAGCNCETCYQCICNRSACNSGAV